MEIRCITVGLLATNCYLVWKEKDAAVLIDPGAEPGKIEAAFASYGVTPCAVVLTHAHFDHFGAAASLVSTYGLPVIVGAEDEEKLSDGEKNLSKAMGRSVKQVCAARTVRDGDAFEIGGLSFEVLATPGHSAGSVTYRLENALFTGDALFAGSVGRTDFPDSGPKAMVQTLRRLAGLAGDFLVFPGHGPETTLETERRTNPFLERVR